MLSLKLGLVSLLLLGLAVAAPQNLNNNQAAPKEDVAAAGKQHRVERSRRGLLAEDQQEGGKLDLEHEIPLRVLEKSLEINDGEGDNEVNGTKKIDNKKIEYYHKKNKGTIKTIVEEKDQDENKMENVFYHLSYEKETASTVGEPEETTLPEEDTTDQTMADDDDEETVTPPSDNEYLNLNNDVTIQPSSSEETFVPAGSPEAANQDEEQHQPQGNAAGPGWFNNWFNWVGQTIEDSSVTEAAPSPAPSDIPDTPHLDRAIGGGSFTILSPFYFGSIGLKSPDCPQHRPTQISIYFFSFCI